MLTVTVTHLKESYIRRNGIPRSEKATVTEHWIRHGDWLTVMTIVNDPAYLTEPFVRTTDYQLDLHQHIPPYPCDVVEEVDRPRGAVPHHLPGTNMFLTEFPHRYGIPEEAARGGAETMYPEYPTEIEKTPGRGCASKMRLTLILVAFSGIACAQQTSMDSPIHVFRFREISTCCSAPVETSRSRWDRMAYCWWTRVCRR